MDSATTGPVRIVRWLAEAAGCAPADAIVHFCDAFEPYLRHYGQYGIQWPSRAPAVITLGRGPKFAADAAEYVLESGHSEGAVLDAVALQHVIGDDWILLRVTARGSEPPGVVVYFRKALSVPEAAERLRVLGVSGEKIGRFGALAAVAGAGRVGIFGVGLEPDGQRSYHLYLRSNGSASTNVRTRLADAFEHSSLPAGCWQRAVDALTDDRDGPLRDVYLGLELGGQRTESVLALDYFTVPLAIVERTLRRAGALSGDFSPERLGTRFGQSDAENFGLRFAKEGLAWSFYLSPPRG